MKHKRVVVQRRGGPDVLQVVEEDLPEPQPGEARVKILAAGVSALDLMIRARSFPGFPRVPFTPGVDIVGVVGDLGVTVRTIITTEFTGRTKGYEDNSEDELQPLGSSGSGVGSAPSAEVPPGAEQATLTWWQRTCSKSGRGNPNRDYQHHPHEGGAGKTGNSRSPNLGEDAFLGSVNSKSLPLSGHGSTCASIPTPPFLRDR